MDTPFPIDIASDDPSRTSAFDFHLPEALIAQQPLEDRAAARMLVVNRADRTFTHSSVSALPSLLAEGDVLVVNDTKVIPARVFGHKADSGGKVELLLLEELEGGEWSALCGASRRPRVGTTLLLADGRLRGRVTGWGPGGKVILAMSSEVPLLDVLDAAGVPPLPPYIRRKGARTAGERERDRLFYQTVYARVPGAVAAPTAGLHLTSALLAALEARGVFRQSVTLHVGIGTFKPVSAEVISQHVMDPERYEIPAVTAGAVNAARGAGGRVVAIGSTVVRTLEHAADVDGRIVPSSGRTAIFIHPPYRFRSVDVMLTNFHLPRSTLLMMVSAFAGVDLIRQAYAEAIRERYRFYSYGDCMLIL